MVFGKHTFLHDFQQIFLAAFLLRFFAMGEGLDAIFVSSLKGLHRMILLPLSVVNFHNACIF